MPSLDVSLPNLPRALARLMRQIPRGRVASYGDLADALGHRAAARWVGHYLLDHPHGPRCPCHRVVRSTGEVGDYLTRNPAEKIQRLAAEGVAVHNGQIDLEGRRFVDFTTDRPLAELAARQLAWANQAVRTPLPAMVRWVAGVDVSYASASRGVAACTLFDAQSGQRVYHCTVRQTVNMPYITGFLTFRELPLFHRAVQTVRRRGWPIDVVLVDGSGVLHPRGAGVAVSLGLACDLPTIGVTKSLLCGSLDRALRIPSANFDWQAIQHTDELRGAAVCPRHSSQREIYVSAGHRADLMSAVALVDRLLRGHALPEPLYWADRLSRSAARQMQSTVQQPSSARPRRPR